MNRLFVGKKIIRLKEVDSTNTFLQNLNSNSLTFEGLVVCSEFQNKGKGQGINKWYAEPSKNLLFSVLLLPKSNIENQYFLNKAISVSICQALIKLGVEPCIKWPNDILVGNNKIAGVLIENRIKKTRLESSIVGIGLNVNQTDFDSAVQNPTSLKVLTRKTNQVDNVLDVILNFIETNYLKFKNEKFKELQSLYNQFLYLKDTTAKIKIGEEIKEVKILGVDDYGCLLVESEGKSLSISHSEGKIII